MEKPAEGMIGYLLRGLDPEKGTSDLFFRVYEGAIGNFKDYRIDAGDIEIQILDSQLSLYEQHDIEDYDGTLDHNSQVLGGAKDNGKGKT